MGLISDEVVVFLTERNEYLEAASALTYAALSRMKYLADPSRLKTDDVDEVLAKIREVAKEATDAIDNCVNAEAKRGEEIADAEVMQELDAYGFQALSDKGKLAAIAAQKRKTRDERRDGARTGAVIPEGTAPVVRSLHLHKTTETV